MDKQALGLIETVGMAAAVEAADTCVKSANVELIGYELSKGSGLVTVKIKGNVDAVKSAIDAAKISASKINKVFTTLIIPRPSKGIASIVESKDTVGMVSEKEDSNVILEENEQDIDELINHLSEEDKADVESKKKDNYNNEEKVIKVQDDSNDEQKVIKMEDDLNNKQKVIKVQDSFNDKEKLIDMQDKKKKNEICNLCKDPKCPRKKGQPKNMCMHYKEKKV